MLLEDPDANVICTGTAQCTAAVGFFESHDLRYIVDQPGRWLQAKTQQPIGVVGLVIIIHVNEHTSMFGGL